MTSGRISDTELEIKVKKATERISENMHIVANEPSLAFYRLQEHVRKALPPMVEKRVEVTKLHHELQGRCYDVEYGVGAVKSMEAAGESFSNIQELLKNAVFLKQQIKYEEARRSPVKERSMIECTPHVPCVTLQSRVDKAKKDVHTLLQKRLGSECRSKAELQFYVKIVDEESAFCSENQSEEDLTIWRKKWT